MTCYETLRTPAPAADAPMAHHFVKWWRNKFRNGYKKFSGLIMQVTLSEYDSQLSKYSVLKTATVTDLRQRCYQNTRRGPRDQSAPPASRERAKRTQGRNPRRAPPRPAPRRPRPPPAHKNNAANNKKFTLNTPRFSIFGNKDRTACYVCDSYASHAMKSDLLKKKAFSSRPEF
ncbi:hypothetical protein EVAR_19964_1 [Eumeta japonica]|uniref:Uncharacterized protein n=1 Tax=Eumeta variegata TaxID=151549 RepID=A0A4C1YLU5_EUMVA|nr:hypothetical protein EVAR_19964_1 [Eumeta japonica]